MWLACQRASWEPRLPMRMGLRGLLCSLLIVFYRIRDGPKGCGSRRIYLRLDTRPDFKKSIRGLLMKILLIANRRTFLKGTAAVSAAMMLPPVSPAAPVEGMNILGPRPGYTPQVGTLVSMLTWMRPAGTRPVQGITQANLDYLFDANANSIGALLLHLAATETLYQLMTFEGLEYEHFPAVWKEK